jgi:hypothetical protein
MLPAYYIRNELERLRETLRREQVQRELEIRPPMSTWEEREERDGEGSRQESERGVTIIQL